MAKKRPFDTIMALCWALFGNMNTTRPLGVRSLRNWCLFFPMHKIIIQPSLPTYPPSPKPAQAKWMESSIWPIDINACRFGFMHKTNVEQYKPDECFLYNILKSEMNSSKWMIWNGERSDGGKMVSSSYCGPWMPPRAGEALGFAHLPLACLCTVQHPILSELKCNTITKRALWSRCERAKRHHMLPHVPQ